MSTSHAVTQSVIKQLEEAGIPRKNFIIWDRREVDLKESGFTEENYPGIRILGTEYQDEMVVISMPMESITERTVSTAVNISGRL